MSELQLEGPTRTESNTLSMKRLSFDDRVDTDTDISSGEALVLLGRSFKLLGEVKALFFSKFFLSFVAVFPGLIVPWVGKIVVDQVLLQRPFGETEVRFPPFMDPFIHYVADMGPLGIMTTIVAMYALMLLVFGTRGPETYAGMWRTQGQDAATQSEAALSSGGSSAGGLWGVVEMMVNVRLTQRIANGLRTRLFERLTRLSMIDLDDQRIGDSVYRVMYDTPQVPEICFNLSLAPFLALLGAAISLYLMQYSYGQVAPELVWIAGAMIPIGLIVTLPMSALARRVNQASRASGAATTNAIEESIDNISAVQSLGGMERETKRFEERSEESFRRHRYAFLVQQALVVVGMFVTLVVGVYVAIVVTDQIIDGLMTPGDFAVMFGLFMKIGGTALVIGMYWINLQKNVAAVRRVFFFFDFPVENGASEPSRAPVEQTVTLEHVDFQYPDGRRALTDINLELSIGELVAIVGPTGAGKTTLAYLLPGFLRPSAGRVLFDGEDTADVSIDWLRDQVSYVFQEHMLLSESIRENLLFAKPDATEEQMMAACQAAGAREFIQSLPDGIDTVLGRSGDTLSVGQQQRLCIARGLVRDTKVLILDEPTAALDPQTEIALVRSLREAARARLVVVIAHRLSTIRQADRIVFLDDGQVKDVGDHETLMAKPNSPYRRFVELQSG